MAISVGAGSEKGVSPHMNVTPLVDVVLVLLIIFLVVTPLMTKTFWVHLPKQEKEEVPPEELKNDPEQPLLLRVESNDLIQVNGVQIGFEELPYRLQRMFAARDDHLLFFDADDGVDYGFAVSVLDRAREGGAVTIAPLTQALTRPAGDANPAGDGGAPGAGEPAPPPAPAG